jgi:hypothetical protein
MCQGERRQLDSTHAAEIIYITGIQSEIEVSRVQSVTMFKRLSVFSQDKKYNRYLRRYCLRNFQAV